MIWYYVFKKNLDSKNACLLLHAIVVVVLTAVEIFIILVFVVHWVLAFGLGLFSSLGEIDAFAASTAAAVDDVVGRDGFQVALVVVFLF